MSLYETAKRAVDEHGAMQKPTELAALLAIVAAQQPFTVYEIGTATGGTLWALAQAAPKAGFVSIDIPGGPFSGGATIEDNDLFRLVQHRSTAWLRVIHGDSKTVSLPAARPDFVLIDGDHSYEGVKADWARYKPLVNDGGIVAFHDILPHPEETGVQVAPLWEEIAADHETVEIATRDPNRAWGGIGVVYL